MVRQLGNILFWSVISAAFIGPGTITTAASAGADFGYSLLWTLVFATIACLVLQEAAARITIASGMTMGEAIAQKYRGSKKIQIALVFAVVLGCAAYQAGNMLGAVSGISLISNASTKLFTTIILIGSGALLWIGNYSLITKSLGALVGVMGVVFVSVVISMPLDYGEVGKSLVGVNFPDGSGLLIIGLIGTTIVPYNLFLGSGISHGQTISNMRKGLSVAVILGGIISMAVLIVGSSMEGPFSFQGLADALKGQLGDWAPWALGIGLFAAGFTSSITSPLASAVTAQSLIGAKRESWKSNGIWFRVTWLSVMLFGFAFGMLDVKPIPVIIAAQALNGLLLPFITIYLMLLVNDHQIIGRNFRNGRLSNILMLVIVGFTIYLGLSNVTKAAANLFSFNPQSLTVTYSLITVSILGCIGLLISVIRVRKNAGV